MRMVFPAQTSGRLMDDLATDVGTLVESFFGDVADRSRVPGGGRMAVPMDIDESDDAYWVTLDVPGVATDSVAIDVHEDTLTISGDRGSAKTGDAETKPDDGDETHHICLQCLCIGCRCATHRAAQPVPSAQHAPGVLCCNMVDCRPCPRLMECLISLSNISICCRCCCSCCE